MIGIGLFEQAVPAARGAPGLPAAAANSAYVTTAPYGMRAMASSQAWPVADFLSARTGSLKSFNVPPR